MNRFIKSMNAPNSEYAKRGAPTQATNGCDRWNIYVSQAVAQDKDSRKIDVRCKHCNRRVKFLWVRHDDRGRPRPVQVLDRPEHMPKKALIKEMIARNNIRALGEEFEPEDLPKFKKASEIV